MQLPRAVMSKPDKFDRDSDKKQPKKQRHLSGGDELLKGFLLVHECCAEVSNNATPRRFMAFLHCYKQLYKNKKEGIEEKQSHLQVCLALSSSEIVSPHLPLLCPSSSVSEWGMGGTVFLYGKFVILYIAENDF